MAKDEIEHIRTERPPASVVAHAAQSGLGDWIDTLATKQGFGWRKWRDRRPYFFKGGLIVTAPDGHTATYDWRTVRVLRYRRTVNGAAAEACSTLTAFGLSDGSLFFNGAQRRSTAPAYAKAFETPDRDLFTKLCRRLSPNLKG